MKAGDLVQQKHIKKDQTGRLVPTLRTGIVVKVRETVPDPWSDVLVMWSGQTNLSFHTARNLFLLTPS